MFANDVMAQEIWSWIHEKGHFKEMTLTTAGELFVDPAKNTKADECWVYYKPAIYLPGSLYVSCDKEFCAFGEQLKENISVPLMKNKTQIDFYQAGACCIRSRNAGIPNGSSLLVFFRYQSKVVFVVAGDVVKHSSRIIIVEATSENDAVMVNAFNEHLKVANRNLAEKLEGSQFALKMKTPQSEYKLSVNN